MQKDFATKQSKRGGEKSEIPCFIPLAKFFFTVKQLLHDIEIYRALQVTS